MRNGKKGLTPKQSKFVDTYLQTLDAVAAYRAARYRAKTYSAVRASASEILASVNVQAALRERAKKIEHRTEISQDRVRLELGRIAFFDPRRLFDEETGKLIDVPKLPGEVAAAISSVEVTSNKDGERVTKVRFWSKTEGLDKLCRHLGMYQDTLRILGLEKELSTLPDEELERRIIDLGRGEYRAVGDTDTRSGAAAAPALPAAAGKEPPHG